MSYKANTDWLMYSLEGVMCFEKFGADRSVHLYAKLIMNSLFVNSIFYISTSHLNDLLNNEFCIFLHNCNIERPL